MINRQTKQLKKEFKQLMMKLQNKDNIYHSLKI